MTVRGTVVNGTSGGPVPPGIAVTIVQLDQDFKEIVRRTVQAGPGGSFEAGGWDGRAGNRFVASADHQDVTYRAAVTGDSGRVETKVSIYEPASDATVLKIASDTLTVVPGAGNVLEVLQILRVDNGSDRTYVGTTSTAPAPPAAGTPGAPAPPAPGSPGAPEPAKVNTVLQLPVPAGAYDLTAQEGSQVGLTQGADGGVYTAAPISPGEVVVSFLYRVKIPSSGWELRRPVFYPTAKSTVLLGPGLALDADRYRYEGPVTLENRKYGRWDGPALAPGGELAARIGSDRAGSGLVWGLWAVLGALVVAVVAVPLLLRRRRRRAPTGSAGSSAPAAPAGLSRPATPSGASQVSQAPDGPQGSERARLIEEIAALDDALEAGSVPRHEHAERRAALKQRLIALSDVVAPP